jgi:hypothetical protein
MYRAHPPRGRRRQGEATGRTRSRTFYLLEGQAYGRCPCSSALRLSRIHHDQPLFFECSNNARCLLIHKDNTSTSRSDLYGTTRTPTLINRRLRATTNISKLNAIGTLTSSPAMSGRSYLRVAEDPCSLGPWALHRPGHHRSSSGSSLQVHWPSRRAPC